MSFCFLASSSLPATLGNLCKGDAKVFVCFPLVFFFLHSLSKVELFRRHDFVNYPKITASAHAFVESLIEASSFDDSAKARSALNQGRKIWNASRICVSSLRRGHANLLCIVPILVYVLPKRARPTIIIQVVYLFRIDSSKAWTRVVICQL